MPETQSKQLIILHVGRETFVLDIAPLVRIIAYRSPTPVPRSPSFIEGIVVLDNQVVPVINLGSRLFPGEEETGKRPKILILRIDNQVVGFKVDRVVRIITVNTEAILPPPPGLAGLSVEFLKGVVHVDDQVYLYLNSRTLLSPEEINLLRRTAGKKVKTKGKSNA